MLRLVRSTLALVVVSGLVAYCQVASAVIFPQVITFEAENDDDGNPGNGNPNDDGYTPNTSLAVPAYSDPNFGGDAPPAAYPDPPLFAYWRDYRTDFSADSAIEEVPTGWDGISASSGQAFAGVWNEPGGAGLNARPSYSHASIRTTLNAAPTDFTPTDPVGDNPDNIPKNTWSTRMDIYADPDLDDGGPDGIPDQWWTNGMYLAGNDIIDEETGEPVTGYGGEAGMTFQIIQPPVGPKVWRFTAAAGGFASVDLPVGNWYTMETRLIDNRWYGGDSAGDYNYQSPFLPDGVTPNPSFHSDSGDYGYFLQIWDQSHENLLLQIRYDKNNGGTPVFADFKFADLGGPSYSWFAHYQSNVQRILVDNWGVDFPVSYGDMNGDGVRNNFDIQPLEIALTNVALWAAQNPEAAFEPANSNAVAGNIRIQRGDINGDGVLDNFDIQPMERLVTNNWSVIQPPPEDPLTLVPEPSSLALLAAGALGLLFFRRPRKAA